MREERGGGRTNLLLAIIILIPGRASLSRPSFLLVSVV